MRRRRRWSGALAPDEERKELPSCRLRGKRSSVLSREARGACLLSCWGGGPARDLFQEVKEHSSEQ